MTYVLVPVRRALYVFESTPSSARTGARRVRFRSLSPVVFVPATVSVARRSNALGRLGRFALAFDEEDDFDFDAFALLLRLGFAFAAFGFGAAAFGFDRPAMLNVVGALALASTDAASNDCSSASLFSAWIGVIWSRSSSLISSRSVVEIAAAIVSTIFYFFHS